MLAKIISFLNEVISMAVAFLPDSPIKPFISQLSAVPYLGYLNYFVPVGTFLAILQAWTAAIALYYIVMAALRWAKAIE